MALSAELLELLKDELGRGFCLEPYLARLGLLFRSV